MSRRTYQDGTLELIVRLLNGNGELIVPDALPRVDIFPPTKDPRLVTTVDGDALLLSQVSALQGVGTYSFTFTTVPDTEAGTYYDRWHWAEDGVSQDYTFEFIVIERVNLSSFAPASNYLIKVVLDGTIASEDTGELLTTDYIAHFCYTMSPMYSSSRLLELEAGSFLTGIPEDTIDTEIYYASREADIQTFIATHDDEDYFKYIRRQYVTCRALLRLLSNVASRYMLRKRLADLDVTYGNALQDKLNQVANCVKELEPVLNSGANISTHTSLRLQTAMHGQYDPDRPTFGRGWQVGTWPIANVREYPSARHQRVRKTYSNTRSRNDWTEVS